MGITVISAASLNSPGRGASSQLPADNSGGADFAALLTQQITSPQLVDLQLQATPGAKAAIDPKDLTAPTARDGDLAEEDISSLLAAAGLIPAFLAPQQSAQPHLPAGEQPQAGKGGKDASQEPIGGILGQLSTGADQGQKMEGLGAAPKEGPAIGLTADLLKGDTANLAADAKPASGTEQNFAATLAAHTASAQRAQPQNESTATATVNTPLHDTRWSQDFGEKVVWLAKNDQQVAHLNINPPQLGPMQITLNLNGDQASALFVSPHAEVRQAIQDAMPQLREMLAGAGINLGQANVGAQMQQQNTGEQAKFSGSSRAEDDKAILRAENSEGSELPLRTIRGGRGMVDLFA